MYQVKKLTYLNELLIEIMGASKSYINENNIFSKRTIAYAVNALTRKTEQYSMCS